jgi:hypothetical protein
MNKYLQPPGMALSVHATPLFFNFVWKISPSLMFFNLLDIFQECTCSGSLYRETTVYKNITCLSVYVLLSEGFKIDLKCSPPG